MAPTPEIPTCENEPLLPLKNLKHVVLAGNGRRRNAHSRMTVGTCLAELSEFGYWPWKGPRRGPRRQRGHTQAKLVGHSLT